MMNKSKLLCLSLLPLISSCSGMTLAPGHNNEIPVNSEPSGADVYIMGKLQGKTPMVVNLHSVHPVTYNRVNEHLYGRIMVKHVDCEEKTITVNSQIISNGLTAKLDCTKAEDNTAKQQDTADISVVRRLQKLQMLKDKELISEEEFRKIRTRILESI